MKQIVLFALIGALAGCSGKLYTIRNAPGQDVPCADSKCQGVLFHRLIASSDYYFWDKIVATNGDVIRWYGAEAAKACERVPVKEEKLVPDIKESLIVYEPAFFETSTFGVVITPSGTLTSVNVQSTPGPKTAAETLSTLVGVVGSIKNLSGWSASGALPTCSAGRTPMNKVEIQAFENENQAGLPAAPGGDTDKPAA